MFDQDQINELIKTLVVKKIADKVNGAIEELTRQINDVIDAWLACNHDIYEANLTNETRLALYMEELSQIYNEDYFKKFILGEMK